MITRFALVLAIVIGLLPVATSSGQASPDDTVQPVVQPEGDGTRITWRPAPPADPTLPVEPHLVTLRLAEGAAITPHVLALDDAPWAGVASELPGAPVRVLREARQSSERLVVLALSPVYLRDNEVRVVRLLDIHVPVATPFNPDMVAALATTGAVVAPASVPPRPPAFPALPALRVRVSMAGIQVITSAALGAAIAGQPDRIRLSRGGVEVPVELRDVDGGGWGGPADELRFYAPPPGDRWNQSDTYWVTLADGARLRIGSRAVATAPGDAPSTALERGVLRGVAYYDSRYPGSDGDHWFAASLDAEPGQPADQRSTMIVTLTTTLPPVSGIATLDVSTSAHTAAARSLTATVDGTGDSSVTWSGVVTSTQTLIAPVGSVGVAQVRIALTALGGFGIIAVDRVAWQRPVQLVFGSNGAMFSGASGQRAYRFSGAPAGFSLYDITDPAMPVLLQTASSTAFEDAQTARTYLLTGNGTLHVPPVAAYAPATLPTAADAIYIAPAALHATLAPLLDLRRAQGYRVELVDVESVYDGWSYGQVDPRAIRAFLQHAKRTWSVQAAILVGDGSSDPFDYTARGPKNVNLIPPYLAPVDPWLGETACETCYAQLDGDDPTSDRLPDIWLGRLPVKQAAELQDVVAKIVGYETAPPGGAWRARMVYLADDKDTGGDFAAQAEQGIALQPAGMAIQRVFYGEGPGQIAQASMARAATLTQISSGASVVTYFGHAHQQQWAVTALSEPNNWLLHRSDVPLLENGERLPVVLSLTCLSSAFQWPSYIGATIDETLLLKRSGGAVAVWGPTGLGVSHGHDRLQRGFYRALWAAGPPERGVERAVPLGALTEAGMREVFTGSVCCQDTIYTFALLGDPLTRLRVMPGWTTALPLVQR